MILMIKCPKFYIKLLINKISWFKIINKEAIVNINIKINNMFYFKY